MLKTILLPSLGILTLASGCDQIRTPGSDARREASLEAETPPTAAPAPEDAPIVEDIAAPRPTISTKRAEIDWDAARTDFAARDRSGSEGEFTIASGTSAPPVPVLLPSEPVSVASAGDPNGMQFRPLADGYYAVYPGETYDMIINGTDRLAAAPGRGTTATDTELRFEETMIGAQVAFSRYGASYLVEFACKDPTAATTGNGCVAEADAKAAVQDLLLAGTR